MKLVLLGSTLAFGIAVAAVASTGPHLREFDTPAQAASSIQPAEADRVVAAPRIGQAEPSMETLRPIPVIRPRATPSQRADEPLRTQEPLPADEPLPTQDSLPADRGHGGVSHPHEVGWGELQVEAAPAT